MIMRNQHLLTAALLCSVFSLPACAGAAPQAAPAAPAVPAAAPDAAGYDLTFHPERGVRETMHIGQQQIDYYAYRGLVYAVHPKSAADETMNLFIPAAYLEGNSINGYTAATAPIFLPNQVGGYMPGKAGDPKDTHAPGGGTSTLFISPSTETGMGLQFLR